MLQKFVIGAVALAVVAFVVHRVARTVLAGAPPAHGRRARPALPDDGEPAPGEGATERTKTPTTTLALPKGVFERSGVSARPSVD